jgi:hypothetical protein
MVNPAAEKYNPQQHAYGGPLVRIVTASVSHSEETRPNRQKEIDIRWRSESNKTALPPAAYI